MKLFKLFVFMLFSVFTVGCQTTASLQPVKDISRNKVKIIDARSEEAKKTYRSSVMSPLLKLGDNKFETPPMDYLKNELYKNMPEDVSHVTLEIEEFGIFDYFPVRLSGAFDAGMEGSLSSMGIPYASSDEIVGLDSIICSLKGKINNKPIQATAQVPYLLPPFTTLVRKTDEWLGAVKESIKRCAIESFK